MLSLFYIPASLRMRAFYQRRFRGIFGILLLSSVFVLELFSTQYSLDFCLAWALIGEWTSRLLFPVPKGPWPRHGHTDALLPEYRTRSPRLVAWSRAAFEQGALPSLLLLQGLVPIFTLPGDKIFQIQSTGICQGLKGGSGLQSFTPMVVLRQA